MRILFLSQVLPFPLDAGPKTRAYYTLRHLAQKHEVTLLSFVRPPVPAAHLDHLASFCEAVHTVPMLRSRTRDLWHLARSLLMSTPFLLARDWVPAMERSLKVLMAEGGYDAVHADQLWMAPYALRAARVGGDAPPFTILDQHNAVYLIPHRLAQQESKALRRAALEGEARKLARAEGRLCQQFDRVVWVTKEDRAAIVPAEGKGRTDFVVPICVDTESPPLPRPAPHRIVFLGGLHWPPNAAGIVWFLQEVWPHVREANPSARLTLIGKQPPPRITTLAASDSRIEVTGYVEDPLPYLRESAAFIVPLHAGGGMRVKILDAWRWGLPVITTSIGAEGICTQDGDNALIADTPADFAAATLRVLNDPLLAGRLATGGRRTVEHCYDWRKRYAAWDEVYDSLQTVKQSA